MKAKAKPRTGKTLSVRQSVTMPAQLAKEVWRVAKERHLTTSRALVELTQRGIEAESQAKENLKATYQRFMSEADAGRKGTLGRI